MNRDNIYITTFKTILSFAFGCVGFMLFSYISYNIRCYYSQYEIVSTILSLCGCFLFMNFSFFPLIGLRVEDTSTFHEKYNKANLNRQPIKYYVENRHKVVIIYKLIYIAIFFIISSMALSEYF